ncbi:response regulator transcription factor [Acidovorax sp.]|uniref:response regulator transcription factor n=1 Tax=Acidovorax sp. TaxID=1872122 RepID=UPI003D0428EF
MAECVLVIDDEPTFNAVLVRSLARRGVEALGCHTIYEALEAARVFGARRIVLDLNLDGRSGLGLIRPLLQQDPLCKIVVLTGYASVATAVDSIKLGAVQYLAKPTNATAILNAFEAVLPYSEQALPEPQMEPMSVSRLEWEHIQRVLMENAGNISATARALKMHRRTLQRKLSKRPVSA